MPAPRLCVRARVTRPNLVHAGIEHALALTTAPPPCAPTPGAEGLLTVTDDDVIEKSNLSRQFLFRDWDIGSSKSTVSAKAAQRINPALRVNALQNRVSPETGAAGWVGGWVEPATRALWLRTDAASASASMASPAHSPCPPPTHPPIARGCVQRLVLGGAGLRGERAGQCERAVRVSFVGLSVVCVLASHLAVGGLLLRAPPRCVQAEHPPHVAARSLYVDARCVYFGRPLLESGTLGPKCNTQARGQQEEGARGGGACGGHTRALF